MTGVMNMRFPSQASVGQTDRNARSFPLPASGSYPADFCIVPEFSYVIFSRNMSNSAILMEAENNQPCRTYDWSVILYIAADRTVN